MNNTKKITLTGYLVKYVDLREPKPRTQYEVVNPIDRDALAALGLLGLDVSEYITARYTRGGYHVISVERLTPKRTAIIDLQQLWEQSSLESQREEAGV